MRIKGSKPLGAESVTKDAGTDDADDDVEEREIEYMPPKPKGTSFIIRDALIG